MKTFEEYLEKMGYSWNDFDRTYEMENLIEQYADERANQALHISRVIDMCCPYCKSKDIIWHGKTDDCRCNDCGKTGSIIL